jgi:hypothetical protein
MSGSNRQFTAYIFSREARAPIPPPTAFPTTGKGMGAGRIAAAAAEDQACVAGAEDTVAEPSQGTIGVCAVRTPAAIRRAVHDTLTSPCKAGVRKGSPRHKQSISRPPKLAGATLNLHLRQQRTPTAAVAAAIKVGHSDAELQGKGTSQKESGEARSKQPEKRRQVTRRGLDMQ